MGQCGNEEGADDGGAFAEDIVDAEVFAALFSRYESHKVGAADGLNASLKQAHGDGEDPKFREIVQLNGKEGDGRVGGDGYGDEFLTRHSAGKLCEDEGRREGDDLGHKEGEEKPLGFQPQGFAVSRGHIDDGVDAVDVKEEAYEEKEEGFVFVNMGQCLFNAFEIDSLFAPMGLFVALQEREGENKPPCAV